MVFFEIFGMFGIYILSEILFRLMRMKEDPFPNLDNQPVISEDEFEQKIKNGERLVILDNLVLDLTNYELFHPGGKFLLE